jgi:hypothetical protein
VALKISMLKKKKKKRLLMSTVGRRARERAYSKK